MTGMQGAIMGVGASQPTVVASKDKRIGIKNQMQVRIELFFKHFTYLRLKKELTLNCWGLTGECYRRPSYYIWV